MTSLLVRLVALRTRTARKIIEFERALKPHGLTVVQTSLCDNDFFSMNNFDSFMPTPNPEMMKAPVAAAAATARPSAQQCASSTVKPSATPRVRPFAWLEETTTLHIKLAESNRQDPASTTSPSAMSTLTARPWSLQTDDLAIGRAIGLEDLAHVPQLAPAVHKSVLRCTLPSGATREFVGEVHGRIDHTRRDGSRTCFGWDDVFLVDGVNMTYFELSSCSQKISARDESVDKFISEMVHYKHPRDLHHTPLYLQEVVDTTFDPADFIRSIPEYSGDTTCNEHEHEHRRGGVFNIPTEALNRGFFFRSSANRRVGIVWSPGSNAGVPLTPKPRDAMHEKIFMFHDLAHCLIPDLVATFDKSTWAPSIALQKRVYRTARLISEACTLVLADMVMVSECEKRGFLYPSKNERKIFPLYELMRDRVEQLGKEGLRRLLLGSVHMCFWGDSTVWRALIDESHGGGGATHAAVSARADSAISEFRKKYDSYFIEDMRWTVANCDHMSSDMRQHRQVWWDAVSNMVPWLHSASAWIQSSDLERRTRGSSLRAFVDEVFDDVYTAHIHHIVHPTVTKLLPADKRLKRAFTSYMAFQSRIFFEHAEFVPQSHSYWEVVRRSLERLNANDTSRSDTTRADMSRSGTSQSSTPAATDEIKTEIHCIRSFYEDYLRYAHKLRAISADDVTVFRQIYPLFPASYVNYDYESHGVSIEDMTVRALTT